MCTLDKKSSNRSNLNISLTGTDKIDKKQVNPCHRTPERKPQALETPYPVGKS